jgi:TonB family protein
VLIDTKGNVEDVRVIKSNPMLDDAAIAAAWQFKFTPAKQRDRLVKVWMSIPFHFRLKN